MSAALSVIIVSLALPRLLSHEAVDEPGSGVARQYVVSYAHDNKATPVVDPMWWLVGTLGACLFVLWLLIIFFTWLMRRLRFPIIAQQRRTPIHIKQTQHVTVRSTRSAPQMELMQSSSRYAGTSGMSRQEFFRR